MGGKVVYRSVQNQIRNRFRKKVESGIETGIEIKKRYRNCYRNKKLVSVSESMFYLIVVSESVSTTKSGIETGIGVKVAQHRSGRTSRNNTMKLWMKHSKLKASLQF